jgi:hypothetical protein
MKRTAYFKSENDQNFYLIDGVWHSTEATSKYLRKTRASAQ